MADRSASRENSASPFKYSFDVADPTRARDHRPSPSTRALVKATYLSSTQHSSSNSILHFYEATEITQGHRSAVGAAIVSSSTPAARRVLILVDEAGYNMDFDALIQRCVAFSRVQELMALPPPSQCSDSLSTSGGTGTVTLTDLDALLQQAAPMDFVRTVGALFRPQMSGGVPPLYELDEGQPLAIRVNCRRRTKPLRTAIVDGITRDALHALCEEHSRQLNAVRNTLTRSKDEQTTEMVELYQQRDALKGQAAELERQVAKAQSQLRQERDEARLRLATLTEQLHNAREEVKLLKLVRHGIVQPSEIHVTPSSFDGSFNPMEGENMMVERKPGNASTPPMFEDGAPGFETASSKLENGSTAATFSAAPLSPHSVVAQLRRNLEDGERFLQSIKERRPPFVS